MNTSEVDFFLWGWLPQSCLCWAASNQCSDIIGPQSLNTPYVSGEINRRTDSETLSPPWWAHPARWSDRRAVSVLSTAASLFSLHVSDSLNSEVTHTHTHAHAAKSSASEIRFLFFTSCQNQWFTVLLQLPLLNDWSWFLRCKLRETLLFQQNYNNWQQSLSLDIQPQTHPHRHTCTDSYVHLVLPWLPRCWGPCHCASSGLPWRPPALSSLAEKTETERKKRAGQWGWNLAGPFLSFARSAAACAHSDKESVEWKQPGEGWEQGGEE